MKKLLKENLRNVNIGNSAFRAPSREPWNSYSTPARGSTDKARLDKSFQSDEMIGELNPKLEMMQV